ncbi:hypothetical protein DBV14_13615 [Variovorax sp. KBW07]|uniref:hypothetical protein n=1 Tax=Variovorax sp. KBW07 TaxID=2153358 RepID=UPI000F57056D|nr:hypothetical protein [Variovorax sp. KBW07]RQO53809.1 hypothetical protein DBV14_13615 [Variovorax sp. KBW07]
MPLLPSTSKALLATTAALWLSAAVLPTSAFAQASESVRIRGTLVRVDAHTLVVQDRGGEVVSLARPADMAVSEVYRIRLSDIRQGSFIGTAAMPQADGTQKALEVVVFPEAARGTGEGHRPWDLLPQSTMTNATVADLAAAPKSVRGGQQLRLTYKGGEQTVIVPPDVPVVTFRPGTEALLVPGAKVLVNAQEKNGTPTALRVTAGRNGFAPPM